jgi:hypothetical protein
MSDEKDTLLLVIDPTVRIDKKQIARIEAAGFVVVRGNPSDFHIISDNLQPSDGLVLRAALDAIGDFRTNDGYEGNGVRSMFGRNLARALGYGDTVKLK